MTLTALDDKHQAFAAWLALPDALRAPKTQKAFAATVNVTEKTLCEWKKEPAIQEAVKIERDQWFREQSSNVRLGLIKEAQKGNLDAIQFYLLVTGEHVPAPVADSPAFQFNQQVNVLPENLTIAHRLDALQDRFMLAGGTTTNDEGRSVGILDASGDDQPSDTGQPPV